MNKFIKCTLVVVLLLGVAFAGSNNNNNNNNNPGKYKGPQEDDHHRHLSRENNTASHVLFKSVSNETGTELKFSISTTGGVFRLRLDYQSKDENGTVTESEFWFQVSKIVEYYESNNESGFQIGEEVDAINFSKAKWNAISCTESDYDYLCTVSTQDGQFAVDVYIVVNVTVVNGVPLRPTGSKMDIYLNKHSRKNDTRLALVTQLLSVLEQREESQSDEELEGFAKTAERQVSFGDLAFFSWTETATVNGNSVNILNGNLVSEAKNGNRTVNSLVFSFDTTEQGEIVWDPKLSSERTYTSSATEESTTTSDGSSETVTESGAARAFPYIATVFVVIAGLLF